MEAIAAGWLLLWGNFFDFYGGTRTNTKVAVSFDCGDHDISSERYLLLQLFE